jgi:hypothetical protein
MVLQKISIISSALFLFMACKPPAKIVQATIEPTMVSEKFSLASDPPDSELLKELLSKLPEQFLPIIQNPDAYRLQIIFTQIDRDSANKPYFKHHYFRVTDQYTYPASTVKLPAAVLALEKLNRLGVDGLGINTPMFTDPLRAGEKSVFEDKSSKTGKPSIGHYIKKILLVSDNDANNRLYEFLGQEPYNIRLHELGFTQTQMTHRLSISLTDEENRTTNPVWFMGTDGKTIYRQPFALSKMQYPQRNDFLGKGFMKSGGQGNKDILVDQPLDFTIKNRWPVKYAHLLTQWIMFPESQPDTNRLLLSASDYTFLWKYMSMFPGESNSPAYADKKDWPSYVKFLWAGSEKGAWPNSNVRIFNKVGNAYGFLTDAAYIVDFEKKVEFLLSAVIYCNKDEILNDDQYDYDEVGYPFLKALGQTLFEYEQNRPGKIKPDLSRFKMTYTE